MNDISYLSALHFSCIVQDLSLWCIGSAVTALKLSCPTACGSLVPQPGIKPESPLLEDRFLTTGYQGSPWNNYFILSDKWPRCWILHKMSMFFLHISSVEFSCSVVSNSLWPHGLQHIRPPCPSPTPRVYSNSCPLSRWCHPTISSSVNPFSSHLQSFLALGSFQMSQFFTSGGQSIRVSASASVLPMNIQDWFPLGWTGWVSLQTKGHSRVFSNTAVQKHQFFGAHISL